MGPCLLDVSLGWAWLPTPPLDFPYALWSEKKFSKLRRVQKLFRKKKKKSQLCYVSRAVFIHSVSYENQLFGLVH